MSSTEHKDYHEFHAGLSVTGSLAMNTQSITNYHTKSVTGLGNERLGLFSVTGGAFVPRYSIPVGTADWGIVRDVLITHLISIGKDPT